MLNIVVSYDYELFLGDNFKESSIILFEPTDRLIELMGKYGVTSTFFVDVCSVFAHKKYGLNEYVEEFTNQLQKMILNGHDVQLHIHPNWYLSEYIDGRWVFNTSHYMLHRFGYDRKNSLNVYSIIDECIEYLEKTIKPIKPDYKCIAYRAGGYSVQPHSSLFRYLREKGILIDSSVCSNLYCSSATLNYDFRKLPSSPNWWIIPEKAFDYCGTMNEGGLYEVPLLSEKNSLIKKIINQEYSQDFRVEPLNGSFIKLNDSSQVKLNLFSKAMKYMNSYALVSFDSMPAYRMIRYLSRYEKKHDNAIVSVICHPKMVDSGELKNMERVFQELLENRKMLLTNMSNIAKGM